MAYITIPKFTTAKFGGVDVCYSSSTGAATMHDAVTGERIGQLPGIYADEEVFLHAASKEFGGEPDSIERVSLPYNPFLFP